MADRLWFSHAIEALFVRGLGPKLTPEVRAIIAKHGIDLGKLQPAYGIEVVTAAVFELLPLVFPGVAKGEALRQLGVAFMTGYSSTFLGGAMVQMMKVIGTRRSLERMQKNFRTGGNYLETRFTLLGPQSAEVWFNDVNGMPELYQGIVQEGGRLSGSDVTVTIRDVTPPSVTLQIDWR